MRDMAIIGGGAGGLCTAVMTARRFAGVTVTVFERGDRVGKKLSSTGNGRCNISNTDLDIRFYHGDPALAERLLKNFGYREQSEFFKSLGVVFVKEEDGKAYPMSYQAGSVTDALRFAAAELGVKIETGRNVEAITEENGVFSVFSDGKKELFSSVVIACGGAAGGRLGSRDGYRFLKAFGHKIEDISPSVVQIKTETSLVRQLKGIKVNGTVSLTSDSGSRSESGEILFCDYGISGPPVLQVSRLSNSKGARVCLDLNPALSKDDVYRHLKYVKDNFPNRPAKELFAGFMNKKLGFTLLKLNGGDINGPLSSLNDAVLRSTAGSVKSLTLEVTGNTGFENAQVTCGGASTAQFFDSLMSKKVKGLFAVGEVLNVDGDCGGFNLAFCWASANAASNGAISYLKSVKK